jgi:hypothetical protein
MSQEQHKVSVKNKDGILSVSGEGSKIESYLPEGITVDTVKAIDEARDSLIANVCDHIVSYSEKHNIPDYTLKTPISLGGNTTVEVAGTNYAITPSIATNHSEAVTAVTIRATELARKALEDLATGEVIEEVQLAA